GGRSGVRSPQFGRSALRTQHSGLCVGGARNGTGATPRLVGEGLSWRTTSGVRDRGAGHWQDHAGGRLLAPRSGGGRYMAGAWAVYRALRGWGGLSPAPQGARAPVS